MYLTTTSITGIKKIIPVNNKGIETIPSKIFTGKENFANFSSMLSLKYSEYFKVVFGFSGYLGSTFLLFQVSFVQMALVVILEYSLPFCKKIPIKFNYTFKAYNQILWGF